MNKLREQFRRFMVGRYGTDELNRFLTILTLIFVALHLMVKSSILFWMEAACLSVVYLRMFSRNTGRRFQENQAYLRYAFYGREWIRSLRFRLKEGSRYKIFKCPRCGQKLRIPRGHGRISIHCKTCGNEFLGKS